MSYSPFAEFYDKLTCNVNYAGYAGRINRIIRNFRRNTFFPENTCIVDLACGTFSIGAELSKLGYSKLCGVDLSRDMLKIAESKAEKLGISVPFFNQDISKLCLSFKADVFVCALDAINHLNGLPEVASAFLSVRKNMNPGGLFIFDMNTPYKHRKILSDNSFIYELPGLFCAWQNSYRDDDCSVKITLDFFSKDGQSSYKRCQESFREYAYPKNVVEEALRCSGFSVLAEYDELKNFPPHSRTERILYVAKGI